LFQIGFRGVRANGYSGDIALDDITVTVLPIAD